MDQQVKVTITTDASGAVSGFRKFREEADKTEKHSDGITESINTQWVKVAAAVAATAGAAATGWAMIKAGAEIEEQGRVLDNLTRKYSSSADAIVTAMQRASEGMVSRANLMQTALGGIAKGLKPEQLIELSDAAKILGDTVGKDTTTALRDITEALETGRAKGLKGYMGATLDLGDAFGELEKQMTATDKVQAMYLMTMIHATRLQNEQGAAINSTADKVERLEAEYKNVTDAMSVAFKTAVVGVDEFMMRYGRGSVDPLTIGANYLRSLVFDKKGMTGPGVYEVPPIGQEKKPDALQQYEDEMAALRKLMTQRNDAEEARKKATRDAEKASRDLERQALETARAIQKASEEAIAAMKKEVDDGYKETIDHLKGIAEYNELVYQEKTFTTDPYEEAANRIIDAERKKTAVLQDLYEKQHISFQEMEDAKVLVAQNSAKQMIELENRKKSDVYDSQIKFYEQIVGYEQKVYDLKTEQIKMEQKQVIDRASAAAAEAVNQSNIAAAIYVTLSAMADEAQMALELAKARGEAVTAAQEEAAERARKIAEEGYEAAITASQKAAKAQIEAQEMIVAASVKASQDIGKINQETFERYTNLANQSLSALGSVFRGLASVYAEGSEDARKWEEAAKAMEIAQRAVAVVQAVAAIATQGLGDPYTAFARVAAMAATMGALLATIGESAGGGSASAAAVAPAMGNSTVLGAEYGAASESLTNSLALLKETYNMEDIKLSKIYNELRNLNDNITGLVSNILINGGSFDATGFGGTIGQAENIWNQANDTLLSLSLDITTLRKIIGDDASNILGIATGTIGFGIVTDYINQLIGSLVGSIMGGTTKTMVGSTGIEIGDTVIRAIMDGAQVSARKYTWYVTETEGGWFGDDSRVYGTIYSQLDASVVNMFTKIFSNMGNTLLYLAGELGTDINAVYDYVFETTRIHLMGKTGDDISEALVEYFSKIGDQAAEDLFGDVIRQYQEVNEGLLETAVRLVQDKIVVGAWLNMTNQAFNSTIDKTIALTESLLKMAGGMDELTDSMQTYYDAFFSDAEKQYDLENQLRAALGSYGYNLPGTRAGYRDLVESLNLTTEAGQAAYVALMKMSEGADAYYDYLEKAKSSIKESDYTTRVEYLRAINAPKFAEGGISSGPDSGYYATLHGTELVVSQRGKYPARVTEEIGASELMGEVRRLREDIGSAIFTIAADIKKFARLVDDWDSAGVPESRGY